MFFCWLWLLCCVCWLLCVVCLFVVFVRSLLLFVHREHAHEQNRPPELRISGGRFWLRVFLCAFVVLGCSFLPLRANWGERGRKKFHRLLFDFRSEKAWFICGEGKEADDKIGCSLRFSNYTLFLHEIQRASVNFFSSQLYLTKLLFCLRRGSAKKGRRWGLLLTALIGRSCCLCVFLCCCVPSGVLGERSFVKRKAKKKMICYTSAISSGSVSVSAGTADTSILCFMQ